jgi:hypothetical protein
MFPHEMPLAPKRFLGVNLDGWLVGGADERHYRSFITADDLARLVNWRFTHVRLPLDARLLEATEGWHTLTRALALCGQHRLGVVLALRWPDHTALVAEPGAWRPLATWWEHIAAHYRGWEGQLLFDVLDVPDLPDEIPQEVLDELGTVRLSAAAARRPQAPGATAARAWNALAVRLTRAIRAAEPGRTLVVQSPGAQAEAFDRLRPTRDPNTWYSFHGFAPEGLTRRGEGAYPGKVDGERWDRERLERWLAPALEFRATYRVPLYLGAFGATTAGDRQSRLTWMRSLLALSRPQVAGWAFHTYRDPAFGLYDGSAMDYDLLGLLQTE